MMQDKSVITEKDRKRATHCLNCTICNAARDHHKAALWFIKNIERKICPNCKAYEKVYGVKVYDKF